MFVIQALPIHRAGVWLIERKAEVQNYKDFIGVESDHNLACQSAKTDRRQTDRCTRTRALASTAPFIFGTSVSEHSPLVCPLVHEPDATMQTPVLLPLSLGVPTLSHLKGSHQIPFLLRELHLGMGGDKLWDSPSLALFGFWPSKLC